MNSLKVFPVAVVSALILSLAQGCSKGSQKPSVSAGGPAADTVVATLDGKNITLKELDEELGSQLEDLEKQKHQVRKQGLEQMVSQRLVKAEAQKQGLTEEQWLKKNIDDKVPAPPEEEMKKVYEQNAAQLPPGSTFEQFKERIADFMTRSQKQELAKNVFEELKKKANVKLTLPEPARSRKEVAAEGPSKGPNNAPITIVEFSDFQCPYCSRASETVEEVLKAYPGKVRLVFRHYPLPFHKEAPKAAEASLCANEQGKFWEYHDQLFKNQQQLMLADLKNYATAVGLDAAKFGACLDSGKHAAMVSKDMDAGKKLGVNGTPAFFINGIMLSGAQPAEEFKSVIDSELKAL